MCGGSCGQTHACQLGSLPPPQLGQAGHLRGAGWAQSLSQDGPQEDLEGASTLSHKDLCSGVWLALPLDWWLVSAPMTGWGCQAHATVPICISLPHTQQRLPALPGRNLCCLKNR